MSVIRILHNVTYLEQCIVYNINIYYQHINRGWGGHDWGKNTNIFHELVSSGCRASTPPGETGKVREFGNWGKKIGEKSGNSNISSKVWKTEGI